MDKYDQLEQSVVDRGREYMPFAKRQKLAEPLIQKRIDLLNNELRAALKQAWDFGYYLEINTENGPVKLTSDALNQKRTVTFRKKEPR